MVPSAVNIHLDEALRYAGVCGQPDEPLLRAVRSAAQAVETRIRPRYVYRVYDVIHTAAGIELADANVLLTGTMAHRMLRDCRRAALLLCTLGTDFDRMLRTEQARDIAHAALLDACGSAWVEAGCDEAQRELAGRFPALYLTDRFSPGYGDLPLTVQPALCVALDGARRLGVTVTPECLMNPQKTVSAVIGLADTPQAARIRGCKYCTLRETCNLHKGGHTCEA